MGLLAFVASACDQDRDTLQAGVLRQAREQLGLVDARGLLTVIEKRATFACEPLMQRPGAYVSPGLWAAGDAIDGPYPATLEGAVRSGLAAIDRLPD
jgi:predicted NAD/FAD-dependent oxidoreductase